MWEELGVGGSHKRKFFFSEITSQLNLDSLLLEAYILVSKCNFSYHDVKAMTKIERILFIKFYTDELKAQKDAIEQHKY
jgi:hypothetical protein